MKDPSLRSGLNLPGKVALITGASRGIGRETALRFAAAGAKVGVNYFHGEAEAGAVVREIGEEKAMAIRADVADARQVAAMIDAVAARFGRLDILVNNAARYDSNPFDGDDYEAW